jgi:hypothetical protein
MMRQIIENPQLIQELLDEKEKLRLLQAKEKYAG